MAVELRPATMEDLAGFDMREPDRRAVAALGYPSEQHGLRWSFEHSDEVWVVCSNGGVVVVSGVVPMKVDEDGIESATLGALWCAVTNDAGKLAKSICKSALVLTKKWTAKYDALIAMVDAKDDAAQRWVKFLGFTFGNVKIKGEAGEFLTALRGGR